MITNSNTQTSKISHSQKSSPHIGDVILKTEPRLAKKAFIQLQISGSEALHLYSCISLCFIFMRVRVISSVLCVIIPWHYSAQTAAWPGGQSLWAFGRSCALSRPRRREGRCLPLALHQACPWPVPCAQRAGLREHLLGASSCSSREPGRLVGGIRKPGWKGGALAWKGRPQRHSQAAGLSTPW